jgi:NADH dehydrogenase
MARRVFVTGAGGFLGNRVLHHLVKKEIPTVCLVRGKAPDPPPPHTRFVSGDLLDPAGYAAALAGCDTVLHMAAVTGKQSPDGYMRVNRDGAGALLRQARTSGVRRFIFVSSVAAKFRDQFRYFYAQSKQQAEALVTASDLEWTIVRPTMILGKNSPVFASLARLAMLPVMPVFGDGRVPVQPVFVDDLAKCLAALVEEDGLHATKLEIGGPEVISMEDLLQRIRTTSGKPAAPVVHLPVGPIARCLGLMEPVLLPLLPFTAGQLASFCNPGVTTPHPWLKGLGRLTSINEMLRLTTNGHGTA